MGWPGVIRDEGGMLLAHRCAYGPRVIESGNRRGCYRAVTFSCPKPILAKMFPLGKTLRHGAA
jgi:hypothetical protein